MNDLVAERSKVRSVPRADPALPSPSPSPSSSSAPSPSSGPFARPAVNLSASGFAGLFQAIAALRNGAALTALSGCLVAGILLDGSLSTLGGHSSVFLSGLGAVCLLVATAAGINAAGVLLLEQAKRAPRHKLQGAIVHGLLCVPKCGVMGLAMLLVAVVVVAALACAYLVCRAPLFGPLAFVVVFPISVVAAGASFGGLSLCLFLALPAIWEGARLSAAIAQALAIARSRLVESFLLMAAVGGLTLAVGCVIFGVLFAGLLTMLTLSTTVFGADAWSGIVGMLSSGYFGAAFVGEGGSGDYWAAMALGGGLLFAIAGSLVALVPLLGFSLVYLRVSDGGGEPRANRRAAGTASDAAAAAVAAPLDAGCAAGQPLLAPFSTKGGRQAPGALRTRCSQCLSAVASDDVFCDICGYKIG